MPRGDPVLAHLRARPLGVEARLGRLSLDHRRLRRSPGEWVDERTPAAPHSERAKRRLAAEHAWAAWGAALNVPVHIFRLAGIYGPGRNQLETLREGTARRIVKPGQVFSRIHVEDIATVLEASIAKPNAGAIYNVCDDEPAPPHDVIEYAAKLLEYVPATARTIRRGRANDVRNGAEFLHRLQARKERSHQNRTRRYAALSNLSRSRTLFTAQSRPSRTMATTTLSVLQVIPALDAGGAERTAVDVARAVVATGGRAWIATEGGRLAAEAEKAGAKIVTGPFDTKNPLDDLAQRRSASPI